MEEVEISPPGLTGGGRVEVDKEVDVALVGAEVPTHGRAEHVEAPHPVLPAKFLDLRTMLLEDRVHRSASPYTIRPMRVTRPPMR